MTRLPWLPQLCIGWNVPAHYVLRTQTVEIDGIATLRLCPLCLFCLSWDQYLQGAVTVVDDAAMGDADGIVFAWPYVSPPKERCQWQP